MIIELLITLSILCEGSNLINQNWYETECQEYYISCDEKVEDCVLVHGYIYDMQHSPWQRF